jgi:hypothetical protein
MQSSAPILLQGMMQKWSKLHASSLKCSSKGGVYKINMSAKLHVGSRSSPHANWKKWINSCRGD